MNKKAFVIIIGTLLFLTAFKTDKPAYVFFDKDGKEVQYKDLLKDATKADVVLFGELHNNPICHWLELELAKDLYHEKREDLVMGAEMFETDNTLILNEYLSGKIRDKDFESEARLWPNYQTDYKPLIDFAADSNILFVATNIPRRYAAIVHAQGFEGLEDLGEEALKYIAPLPVFYDPELACYKDMMTMAGPHGGENLPKAQALKDATMAWSILQNLSRRKTFLHFNGAYHSDNYQGIVWYLLQEAPRIEILTITTVEQDDIEQLDESEKGKADYIICIPASMTKTY